MSDFLIEKESELRRHPEFEEVHEDDLKALVDFKKSLGIKRVADTSFATADDTSVSVAATPSPSMAASSRRGTLSALSKGSRTSRRSGMSVQSELSPLYEEDDAGDHGGEDDPNESDGSLTPQKRRRLTSSSSQRAEQSSVGSSITKSTYRRGTIPEENEQDEIDSGKDSEE